VTVALTPRVYIDGTDVAGITLGGAQITYGRPTPTAPDQPATAFLQLLTVDSVPQVADEWPDFSPGAFGAPSGYVTKFEDTWNGVSSRLSVGVDVRVTLEAGAYTNTYEDEWAGVTVPRFTGRVTALNYLPGQVDVTAVDATERLGFVADDAPYPEETDTQRAVRLAALGGVDVEVTGSAAVMLAGDPDQGAEQVQHLAVGQEITTQARYARAVFTSTPDGKVQYRTRDTPPNPYLWARAAGHSPHLGKVMTRYNLVSNPAMRLDVDGWVPNTTDRWAQQYQGPSPTGSYYCAGWLGAKNDARSAYALIDYDVVPGVAYTFTVWTYTLTTTHTVHTRIAWYDVDDHLILDDTSEPTETPDLTWNLAPPVTSVCPDGAVTARVSVMFEGRSMTACYFTAAMMEPTPFVFPYFDGSFSNAEWLGEANESPSEFVSPPWPLPTDRVVEPDLAFRLDLGSVVNSARVTYVTTDVDGNQDSAEATYTDPNSVGFFGERVERYSTRLVNEQDAADLARASVDAYSEPVWTADAVTVILTDADGREQLAAGTVTFGDEVQVGDLPKGGPAQEITAEVIGWADYLGPSGQWELTYHLARYSTITPGVRP